MEAPKEYKIPISLISIPDKKKISTLNSVIRNCEKCVGKDITAGLCDMCHANITAVNRYIESNIPVDYWASDMNNFHGNKILYKKYNDVTLDIHKSYDNGARYCFAGQHGVGKTMTCACILKKAVEKGFSGLYTTFTDVVTLMVSKNSDKYEIKQTLLMVDFLVIDEFDSRFMGSDNAADMYGRIIEPTLRHRLQNRLPLFLCTNNIDVASGFKGSLKESISSLMKMVNIVPIIGSDFRAEKK